MVFCGIEGSQAPSCCSTPKNSSIHKICCRKKMFFSAHPLLKCWQGTAGCPSRCHQPAKVSSARVRKTVRTIQEKLDCPPSWVILGLDHFVFSNKIKLNGILKRLIFFKIANLRGLSAVFLKIPFLGGPFVSSLGTCDCWNSCFISLQDFENRGSEVFEKESRTRAAFSSG